MAEEKVLVCDRQQVKACPGEVVSWFLSDGDTTRRVDLCPKHARPLLELWDAGVASSGPPVKRHRMERTVLKKTARTKQLKVARP